MYYTDSKLCTESVTSTKSLGCFFILAKSTLKPSFWQYVWAGMLNFLFELGWPTFQRIINIGDYTDQLEDEIMRGRPHYTLHRMVVRPDLQGKGLGSRCLLKAIQETADIDQVPIFLSTQKEINLCFYGKL
jgi:GNAT superfamily N-acetyltransferase